MRIGCKRQSSVNVLFQNDVPGPAAMRRVNIVACAKCAAGMLYANVEFPPGIVYNKAVTNG